MLLKMTSVGTVTRPDRHIPTFKTRVFNLSSHKYLFKSYCGLFCLIFFFSRSLGWPLSQSVTEADLEHLSSCLYLRVLASRLAGCSLQHVLCAAEAREPSQTYLTVKQKSSKKEWVGVFIPQKPRQEDCEFEANLGYCVTLSGGKDVISTVVLSVVSGLCYLCLMGSL